MYLDWYVHWLIWTLIDMYIDWYVHWLIWTLIDMFINWYVHWLICSLIDMFIDWYLHWLICTLIDVFIDWYGHWLICTLIDMFIDWGAREEEEEHGMHSKREPTIEDVVGINLDVWAHFIISLFRLVFLNPGRMSQPFYYFVVYYLGSLARTSPFYY